MGRVSDALGWNGTIRQEAKGKKNRIRLRDAKKLLSLILEQKGETI
jgi:hypothetical protein